jgi:hypothetical protein
MQVLQIYLAQAPPQPGFFLYDVQALATGTSPASQPLVGNMLPPGSAQAGQQCTGPLAYVGPQYVVPGQHTTPYPNAALPLLLACCRLSWPTGCNAPTNVSSLSLVQQ